MRVSPLEYDVRKQAHTVSIPMSELGIPGASFAGSPCSLANAVVFDTRSRVTPLLSSVSRTAPLASQIVTVMTPCRALSSADPLTRIQTPGAKCAVQLLSHQLHIYPRKLFQGSARNAMNAITYATEHGLGGNRDDEVGLALSCVRCRSRSGRARETWVRSAAGELRRMRISVAAIAYSLETIVVASRHLAHQVRAVRWASPPRLLCRMCCLALWVLSSLLLLPLRPFLTKPCFSPHFSFPGYVRLFAQTSVPRGATPGSVVSCQVRCATILVAVYGDACF